MFASSCEGLIFHSERPQICGLFAMETKCLN